MGFMDELIGAFAPVSGKGTVGGWFTSAKDALFGSGPEVSYAPKSTGQLSIEKLLQQYLQQYQGQMTGATPTPTYTGQMTAGLTPLQTQSISNIGGLQDLIGQTGALSPAITDIMSKLQSFGEGDILSKTMSTISGLQNLGQGNDVLSQIMKMISGESFDPSYMRAAYQTGIEDPLRRTFTETTMPAIESAYAKSGLFYGSDKQRQVQDTSATLMNALAQGRTGLESNIYTAGLAQQQAGIDDFSQWLAGQGGLAQLGMTAETQAETLRLKAAEQAGALGLKGEEQAETKRMQTMSQMMQGLGLGMTAGGVEQATTQAELTNQYNQWLRTQAGTMPTDQLLQEILNMYGGYGDQAIVTPSQPGLLQQLAPFAGPLAYAMSSKILKHDIKNINNPIQKLNMINGVSFKWNENDEEDIGVIAEEVEKIAPEAIAEVDGVKSVYYYKLIPILIESVKQQQLMINDLQEKIGMGG